MLLQGPLAVARRNGSRRLSIEGGALDAGDPPSASRLATWVDQWVHVDGRPEWTFVKVHSHGATDRNARVMLGEPMAGLHGALGEMRSRDGWRVHYVSAREMYNVARAAMDGKAGDPSEYSTTRCRPPSASPGRPDRRGGRFRPCVDPALAGRR